MKQIYEIIKECKDVKNVKGALDIIASNSDNNILKQVLYYTYHPKAKWYVSEFPKDYKQPDTLPGVSISNLYSEIRRLYLFQVGHPTADALNETRRNELLLQTLEGMEPEEAKVFVNIMKGDLGIKGLDYTQIEKVFPNLFGE